MLVIVTAGASATLHLAMLHGFTFSKGPDQTWAYQWAVTMAPWSTVPFFTAGLLLGRHRTSLQVLHPSHRAAITGLACFAFAFTWLKGSLAPVDLIWVSWLFVSIRDAKFLRTSLVAWIGRRSYATYFTHFLVIDAIGSAPVHEALHFERLGKFGLVVLPIVVLLLASLLSQFLWRIVEQPAIRVSRSLASGSTHKSSKTLD